MSDVVPSIRTVAVFVAAMLYAVMGVFPYLASVLLAPMSGVAFLMLSWVLGLIGVAMLVRRRSLWVLTAPPLAAAYWAAVVTIGERAFGWTA